VRLLFSCHITGSQRNEAAKPNRPAYDSGDIDEFTSLSEDLSVQRGIKIALEELGSADAKARQYSNQPMIGTARPDPGKNFMNSGTQS